jgi:hypothetical protein
LLGNGLASFCAGRNLWNYFHKFLVRPLSLALADPSLDHSRYGNTLTRRERCAPFVLASLRKQTVNRGWQRDRRFPLVQVP